MKERIFVVSDFHGVGEVYNTITEYLDELALCNPNEKIKLLINGDIIDRGLNSIEILNDIIDRKNKEKGFFDIEVLAGNHELMMFEAINLQTKEKWLYTNELSWFIPSNGGIYTAFDYDDLSEKKQSIIKTFLSEIELQKSYNHMMLDTNGVIVTHAHASKIIKKLEDDFNLHYKLEDITQDIRSYYVQKQEPSEKFLEFLHTVWDRKGDCNNLGLNNYFTIIGHTTVDNFNGYEYDRFNNVLNIDGGCADLAKGIKKEITVPLVELDFENNQLIINRFKNNGKQLKTHYITNKGIIREQPKELIKTRVR